MEQHEKIIKTKQKDNKTTSASFHAWSGSMDPDRKLKKLIETSVVGVQLREHVRC
jgi:hypothetical protein